ncbi:HNH endonuclease [Rubripirellula obstinata]|uniref:HNH endonuclease n=1 Tax=Rubripirellula obstinata TaxID=406547 RepID=A0A5B1CEF6_9BACT|nr:HNH endonuclease [Rubripirellula obstinata]
MTVNESTKTIVRERAGHRCEYCQLHQDDSPLATLHVEHIIPRKHGGSDEVENLALACIDCNLHKGPNLTGVDPETEEITVLFHPRQDDWDDHFEWQGIQIVGKTPTGRTTVRVLEMNSDEQLGLRLS